MVWRGSIDATDAVDGNVGKILMQIATVRARDALDMHASDGRSFLRTSDHDRGLGCSSKPSLDLIVGISGVSCGSQCYCSAGAGANTSAT